MGGAWREAEVQEAQSPGSRVWEAACGSCCQAWPHLGHRRPLRLLSGLRSPGVLTHPEAGTHLQPPRKHLPVPRHLPGNRIPDTSPQRELKSESAFYHDASGHLRARFEKTRPSFTTDSVLHLNRPLGEQPSPPSTPLSSSPSAGVLGATVIWQGLCPWPKYVGRGGELV